MASKPDKETHFSVPVSPDMEIAKPFVAVLVGWGSRDWELQILSRTPRDPLDIAWASVILQSAARSAGIEMMVDGYKRHPILSMSDLPPEAN